MSFRKLLKSFGLMKVSDTEVILENIVLRDLEELKKWLKEDAPELYEKWKPNAEDEKKEYVKKYFSEVLKSEWMIRKGK